VLTLLYRIRDLSNRETEAEGEAKVAAGAEVITGTEVAE